MSINKIVVLRAVSSVFLMYPAMELLAVNVPYFPGLMLVKIAPTHACANEFIRCARASDIYV